MVLNLNKFGKFRNKSFEISDKLTLFYGENESGKTTIFDSLMLLFSENKKTSTFAKQIKLRYGDNIDINIIPEIDASKKMHPQSYNNLYSIRQSEIIFEMSDSKKDSKDWESEIKKKLFASDIDVGKIISEVKAEYSGKSQNAIPAQLKNLKYRNEEIKEELNNLYRKVNTEVSKKDKLKELNDLLKESDNLIKEKVIEYNKMNALKEEKNKSREKNSVLNILTMINDFYKKDKFIKENINLQKDHSKTINDISKKIDECENNIAYLKGKIEALTTELGIGDNVIFAGLRSDVNRILQAMDVFLFPSTYEGLPLSIIEAQAAGVPCLISDKVPIECQKTDLVRQLPLKESLDVWRDAVIDAGKVLKRDTSEEISNAGFDICSNVKWLENFYLDKYQEIAKIDRGNA